MRILYFFCCFFFFAATLTAQYEQGNWYLNADMNTSGAGTRRGVGARAGVGYFVKDRFLVGVRTSTGYFNTDFEGGDVRVNPYARYYLPGKNPNLSYFAEVGAKFGYGRRGDHSFTAAIGAEYQVVPGVMLTASLNYKTANEYDPQSLSLNMGLNVILGERYKPSEKYDFLHRKGTLMLNGSIGNLSLSGTGGDLTLGGNLELGAAYFLSERFLVEGAFSYSAGILELGTEDLPRRASLRSLSASVGGRYFFLPGKRLQPYVGAGLMFEKGGIGSLRNGHSNYYANAKAGFLYHLNDRLAVDFHLDYRKNLQKYSYNQNQLSGGVGFKVFLGKKR